MKKYLIIMVAILAVLTICACADTPATDPGTGSSAPLASVNDPTGTTTAKPTPPATQKIPEETGIATVPSSTTESTPATTEPTESTPLPTDPTEPHYCAYSQTETVAATCTEEGYTLYVCDCGQSFKAVSSKIPHDYQQTEDGLRCTACGAIKEDANPVEEEPDADS